MRQPGAATLDRASVPASVEEALESAVAWRQEEERKGTLIGSETLWLEAYLRYQSLLPDIDGDEAAMSWSRLVSGIVFENPKTPRNERAAVAEACALWRNGDDQTPVEHARTLHQIAERHNVQPARVLGVSGPATAYPWMFPRDRWRPSVVGESLHLLLAPFDWEPGLAPDRQWLEERVVDTPPPMLLAELHGRAPHGSELERMLAAVLGLVRNLEAEAKDLSIMEPHAFIGALAQHGLSEPDVDRLHCRLLLIREALILAKSLQLYRSAERAVVIAHQSSDHDPEAALASIGRAANIYKRLCVAQMYPERLLERQHQVSREAEEIRHEAALADGRCDQVLLVSTFNSPADLQRLLLSVTHELMAFSYGRRVHLIVSDDSTPEMRERNRRIIDDARTAGLSVSHWDIDRKNSFLDELNQEVFADGGFDVQDLAGVRKPSEKAVPYGRFRNFLRMAAIKEVRELGLEQPILTWLDQDNEIGALVLTKAGKLSKRHVFNYFDQKSKLFEQSDLLVGGGGYTNDALEGVEKFWVAWGIFHQAFGLAENHDPDGPPLLPVDADITRFRPWDRPETLERLPREGEAVATLSDQVALLLSTLLGTFRGKYDNQVQVYHPWTAGYVEPDEVLVEEHRPFAGMPGGNTTFATEVLGSPIPFITVGGRGEDIFHLWQLEAGHDTGSVCLTHTPALHTRNVRSGRSDLMTEIIDSYNGRILREPPLLWGALSRMFTGQEQDPDAMAEVLAQSAQYVENLRGEAKARIEEVSSFATALEPYVDENSDAWWVRRGQDDPQFAGLLSELREMVTKFKDVERYTELAEEKLFSVEDVEELSQQFLAAYPHWQTVVQHLGGPEQRPAADMAGAASVTPFPGYGSHSPELESEPAQHSRGRSDATVEPLEPNDPLVDPPWREVLASSLLLFRRYEIGRAQADAGLDQSQRIARLREIFEHYRSLVGEVPEFVWTRLYRDALLIPFSLPYQAVTALLSREPEGLDAEGMASEVPRVAEEFGVDQAILQPAIGMPAAVAVA